MLKKHLALCLLGSVIVAAPALAQTNPAPASPPSPAANTQPVPRGSSGQGGPTSFIEVRSEDQFRASDLMGSRVYGANNENIGEINDVLMDQNGRVHAIVIGVGGFLGIGEKDVAVPMSALQFMADNPATAQQDATTTGSVTTPAAPATSTAPAPANNTANLSANAPAGRASTAPNASTAAQADDGVPNRIVLSMTKEQLNSAPTFRDNPNAQRGTDTTRTPANPNAPATAPRQ